METSVVLYPVLVNVAAALETSGAPPDVLLAAVNAIELPAESTAKQKCSLTQEMLLILVVPSMLFGADQPDPLNVSALPWLSTATQNVVLVQDMALSAVLPSIDVGDDHVELL
jgi:hypothetical protein